MVVVNCDLFNIIVGQDMLSEALLCFGASSTTIDEKDENESSESDEVNTLYLSALAGKLSAYI